MEGISFDPWVWAIELKKAKMMRRGMLRLRPISMLDRDLTRLFFNPNIMVYNGFER
jgi:hypothetical protein